MTFLDEKGRLFGKLSLLDLFLLVFLISLSPIGYYAYRSFVIWEPVIFRIDHALVNAEKGGVIAVYGKNFQRSSVIKLGNQKLPDVTYVYDTVLEAKIPPHLTLGKYSVQVINSNGLVATQKDAITLFVEPRIKWVIPRRIRINGETQVGIYGRNFDSSSTVKFGDILISPVEYVSDKFLRVRLRPWKVPIGIHTLFVTNGYGLTDSQEGAIEAVEPGVVVRFLLKIDYKSEQKLLNMRPVSNKFPEGEVCLVHIVADSFFTKSSQNFDYLKEQKKQQEQKEQQNGWMIADILLPVDAGTFGVGGEYISQDSLLNHGSEIAINIRGLLVQGVVISKAEPLSIYNPKATYRHN